VTPLQNWWLISVATYNNSNLASAVPTDRYSYNAAMLQIVNLKDYPLWCIREKRYLHAYWYMRFNSDFDIQTHTHTHTHTHTNEQTNKTWHNIKNMSPLMKYKSIHFPASLSHVAQERSGGCSVKQARSFAHRNKYTVTISGVPIASAKSYTEKESVWYDMIYRVSQEERT